MINLVLLLLLLLYLFSGWFIGLFCATAQLLTLFLFVRAGDLSNADSDIKYTLLCLKNSLECEDKKTVSTYGYIILSWVLAAWLLRDIVGSMKLFMLAMYKQNIDFLVTSAIIFLVTFFSAWTSIYYNMAIGTKNTDIIVNAVILLFVNDLDEQLFLLAECCSASWVKGTYETYSFYFFSVLSFILFYILLHHHHSLKKMSCFINLIS